MAQASKAVKTTYTLELSEDEARAMRNILGRVGGPPATTPRKHADALIKALTAVGVVCDYDNDGLTGHLTYR